MDFLNMLNMVEIQQLRKLVNANTKNIDELDYTTYNILLQMYYENKILNKSGLFFDGFSDLNKEEQTYTKNTVALNAGGTTVTVEKIDGFTVGEGFIIGNGTNIEGAKITAINATTKTLTFTPGTSFSYPIGSPVVRSTSIVSTSEKIVKPFNSGSPAYFSLLNSNYYSIKQVFPEEMKKAKLWYNHTPLLKRTIEKSEVKGATSILTYEGYGFNVGDTIIIFKDSGNIQKNKITAITPITGTRATVFTLEIPLSFDVAALTSKIYSYDHTFKLSINPVNGTEDFQPFSYLSTTYAGNDSFEETYEYLQETGDKEVQVKIETKRPISYVKNLLTANQSSFETDQTTGFSTAANFSYTLDRPSWAGRNGSTYALRFINTYNGRNDFSWQIVNNRIAVTPGRQYSFWGYCNYWNQTNANVTVEKFYGIMYYYDAAGNIIQTTTGEQFTPSGQQAADWDKFAVTAPAPVGASTVNVRFYCKNVDVGSYVFIDGLQLEESGVPTFIWTLGGTTKEVNPIVTKYGVAYSI